MQQLTYEREINGHENLGLQIIQIGNENSLAPLDTIAGRKAFYSHREVSLATFEVVIDDQSALIPVNVPQRYSELGIKDNKRSIDLEVPNKHKDVRGDPVKSQNSRIQL